MQGFSMIRSNTLSALLLPLALAACSSSAQDGGSDAAADAAPPIHLQQILLDRKDGKVPLQELYREALANCRKGSVPVKPLDADAADKLGRDYVESWYEGGRMAVREDRWSYDVDQMCLFRPVHKRSLSIVDGHGSQQIDLDRHTGHFDPGVRLDRTPQEQTTPPADDKLKAAVAAQLAQQGQGDLMAHDDGVQTEAGQPCKRMHNATDDLCVWSGGTRWGFDDAAGNGPYSVPQTSGIVLSAQPADGGDGRYLSTQKMTVGERFDEGVFSRPSGIAMDKAP
jgi:hypothetical protein